MGQRFDTYKSEMLGRSESPHMLSNEAGHKLADTNEIRLELGKLNTELQNLSGCVESVDINSDRIKRKVAPSPMRKGRSLPRLGMHSDMDCDTAAGDATGMQGARTRTGALCLVASLQKPLYVSLRGDLATQYAREGQMGAFVNPGLLPLCSRKYKVSFQTSINPIAALALCAADWFGPLVGSETGWGFEGVQISSLLH